MVERNERSAKKSWRLTEEQKGEIREALLAGVKQKVLAEKFGVTIAAISLLNRALRAELGDPEAIARAEAKRMPRISREEWDRFGETLRHSKPSDHGIEEPGASGKGPPWTLDSATRLAEKLFGRTPPPVRLKEAFERAFPQPRPDPLLAKPKYPERITAESLTPEQRKDKQLAAYLTSETFRQIQLREYADALEHYNRRMEAESRLEETAKETPPNPPISPNVPQKRKGPAFTKPKRRKRRKRNRARKK